MLPPCVKDIFLYHLNVFHVGIILLIHVSIKKSNVSYKSYEKFLNETEVEKLNIYVGKH